MAQSDPIADYIAMIRNAAKAGLRKVDIPASRMKLELTKILMEYGYLRNYTVIEDGKQGTIRIYLKYDEQKKSVISGIERVSKPGRRLYVGVDQIPRVFNNLGIAILSTPHGVLTDRDARKLRVGGELICRVW